MRIKSSVSKETEEMPDMGTSFTMIPRAFFKDEKYSCLSPHAMILYGLMRDRSLMSEKRPSFSDSDGTYVIYSRDDICSELGCGHGKAGKALKELQTYGLIIGKHQGRNKPNKYYVENIRAYLLAVLFNAPVTINNYYDAEVKYDFGICG